MTSPCSPALRSALPQPCSAPQLYSVLMPFCPITSCSVMSVLSSAATMDTSPIGIIPCRCYPQLPTVIGSQVLGGSGSHLWLVQCLTFCTHRVSILRLRWHSILGHAPRYFRCTLSFILPHSIPRSTRSSSCLNNTIMLLIAIKSDRFPIFATTHSLWDLLSPINY
jgi:hypothetical protein